MYVGRYNIDTYVVFLYHTLPMYVYLFDKFMNHQIRLKNSQCEWV